MAIQHLPQQTVRRLGASQVLTDSAALVKELVDNALDAHATNISVEIHANTIDVIQVRDNGRGIPGGDDRQLVAKRYCTSKITSEDDLMKVGGSTLGFRGEALASAAAISGSLTITTRTQSEQVAIALKVNQLGDVFATERSSLPVGTTVRVADFFAGNPVRRQMAFKNLDKCLKNVKQLLQAYAFARPSVRLSLKVLKAKHDKHDWLYAPSPNGKIEDAACKIVGVACASQCEFSIMEHAGFSLSAFFPRPDADQAKIENSGSFIFVDGRPVSDVRGTFKQLIKMFREALKRANPRFSTVPRPFLYLSICCPADSYDVNVEPRKDDVMFTNPEDVIEASRRLFDDAYGIVHRESIPRTTEKVSIQHCVTSSTASNGTDVLRAAAITPDLPLSTHAMHPGVEASESQTSAPGHSPSIRANVPAIDRQNSAAPTPTSQDDEASNVFVESSHERPTKRTQLFRPNMYGCDDDDMEVLGNMPQPDHTNEGLEELREAQKDSRVTNPWVFAKMNSSRRSPPQSQPGLMAPISATVPRSSALLASSPIAQQLAANSVSAACLPTPQNSSSSPKRPPRLGGQLQHLKDATSGGITAPHAPPSFHLAASQSSLNTDNDSTAVSELRCDRETLIRESILTRTEQWITEEQPVEAIPSIRSMNRRPKKGLGTTNINKPFVPPARVVASAEAMRSDRPEDSRTTLRQHVHHRSRQSDHTLLAAATRCETRDPDDIPSQLLPQRGNRDIRESFATAGLSRPSSVPLAHQERHNMNDEQRFDMSTFDSSEGDRAPTHNAILSSTGFMPASEISAIRAHVQARQGGDNIVAPHHPSGIRPLPEAVHNDQAVDGQHPPPVVTARKLSRRRSSRKLSCARSANLPLERIPANSAMHNVEVHMQFDVDEVSEVATKIDEKRTILGWDQAAFTPYDAFAQPLQSVEVQKLAAVVKELLLLKVSSAQIVEDLGDLLSKAVEQHHEDVNV